MLIRLVDRSQGLTAPRHPHPRPTRPRRRGAEAADTTETDEEDVIGEVDYSDLLANFDEHDDLDDEEATELGDGVALDTPEELDLSEDAEPIETGPLIDEEPLESFVGEDDVGPNDLDLASELDELPPAADDEEDRSTEDLAGLVGELPPLDVKDGDDDEGTLDPAQMLDLEEERPALIREHWPLITPDLPAGPRHVVRVDAEGVLLGGHALERWTHGGEREELATLGTPISGLVPTGRGHLLATLTGEVLSLAGGLPTRVDGWRVTAGLPPDRAVDIQLSGSPVRALLRSSSGALVASDDGGKTWSQLPSTGAVLALSDAFPYWMAIRDGETVGLVRERSSDGAVHLAPPEVATILEEGCLVTSHDSVVVVGKSGRGVAVSTDEARTFRRLKGLSSVTALALGKLPNGPSLFVATFSAAGNVSSLHRVDLDQLEVRLVGEIRASDDDDDASVLSLGFDDVERSLWAVGGFGVRVFGRPD